MLFWSWTWSRRFDELEGTYDTLRDPASVLAGCQLSLKGSPRSWTRCTCSPAVQPGTCCSGQPALKLTNIPCRLDLAELDESVSGLVEGGGDDGGGLGLSLGADDGGLALLLGLLDDELGALGVLLRDLLLLDGRRELLSEPDG